MFAGVVTGVLRRWGLINSTYTYRFRMTVELDTPEGLRTGYSVHEQTATKYAFPGYFGGAKRDLQTRGEAVAVDLPGGQTLFALLSDSRLTQSVLDPQWKNDWIESGKRISSGSTPRGPLAMTPGNPNSRFGPLIGYPRLVRFLDVANPKTIEEIDPTNFAAKFGPSVALKQITIELTDEWVTTGIKARLNWLGEYPEPSLSPNHGPKDFTLAARLHHGDFRR